jgi:hypothetical protein
MMNRPLPSRQFQDLIVWQKAHEFVLLIYQFVRNFPTDEKFGLTFIKNSRVL